MRLAKIVSTLGPASGSPEMIRALLIAGVNVFRLNFSHGEHEVLRGIVTTIRDLAVELERPVAILADLQGPKFRVGEFEGNVPILLEPGARIGFSASTSPGNARLITTNTPQIVHELNVGDEVLLNDGVLALEVVDRVSPDELVCRVIRGGLLGERKGINVPGLKMTDIEALTEKDKVDAVFALEQGVDYMALSFVRSYQDVLYLRHFPESHLKPDDVLPRIVAKIEKPQALDEIDAIIQASDAIMVARGDLGVELRPERVPIVQKMIIRKANEAEKPVITATQMLESMIHSATPTRAEVSDVANAVFDGSDALMLSGETAVGAYPVEAVEIMARVILEAERHTRETVSAPELIENAVGSESSGDKILKFHQAIAMAACFAAAKAKTRAIIVLSYSGSMAPRVSKRKPLQPILALTPRTSVYHALSLVRGVYPLRVPETETTEDTLIQAEAAILKRGLLQKLDPVVFCAGQTHLSGLTNAIKIYLFGDVQQGRQSSSATAQPATPDPMASAL